METLADFEYRKCVPKRSPIFKFRTLPRTTCKLHCRFTTTASSSPQYISHVALELPEFECRLLRLLQHETPRFFRVWISCPFPEP